MALASTVKVSINCFVIDGAVIQSIPSNAAGGKQANGMRQEDIVVAGNTQFTDW
jgi:hypothetical protein